MTYAITGGNKVLFTLNESSGELTVIGNIDREDEDEYELTITASDGGKDRFTGERYTLITNNRLSLGTYPLHRVEGVWYCMHHRVVSFP